VPLTLAAVAAAGAASALATYGAIRAYDHLSGRALVRDAIDRILLARRPIDAWAARALARPPHARASLVVCLTTTPTRIDLLAPTLASLFAQTRPPRRIDLHLPAFSAREGRAYAIPRWLARLAAAGAVTIVRTADHGPATKLLPALARHRPGTPLLVIDDDVIFPRRYVAEMEAWARRFPEAVVAASGWVVPDDRIDRPTTLVSNLLERPPTPIPGTRLVRGQPRRVDVVQGCGGYVVRPRFFDPRSVHDFAGAPDAARWVDDVWISAHANAPKWVVPLGRYVFAPLRHRRIRRASALGLVNRGEGGPLGRANTIVLHHFQGRWLFERRDAREHA
jgi:hypothetical protein